MSRVARLAVWAVISTAVIGKTAAFGEQLQPEVKVEVKALEQGERESFSLRVEVELPQRLAAAARVMTFREGVWQASELPHQPRIIGTNGEELRISRRSPDGAPAARFTVFAKRKAELDWLVVRIGEQRFPVQIGKAKPGVVKEKEPSQYGPLAGRFPAKNKTWTKALQRRLLASTVLIRTAEGSGTGTIVETPEALRRLVSSGYVLVATAAHVVPPQLRPDAVEVDLFDFDGELRPSKAATASAFVLATDEHYENPDVGWLIFDPAGRDVAQAPIAGAERWYSRKQRYFTVGCPAGKPPESRFVEALFGKATKEGGVVSVSGKSEKGESGGPLFDADGYLVGIRSGTDDTPLRFLVGPGVLGAPEEGEGFRELRTSSYSHPASNLGSAPKRAAEQARRDFEAAIRLLPSAEQKKLRQQFESAWRLTTSGAKSEDEE